MSEGERSTPPAEVAPQTPPPPSASRGLVGKAPAQQGNAKFVSKRRFAEHAHNVHQEAMLVRQTAIDAAAAARVTAQDASNERAEYNEQKLHTLERMLGRIGDLVDAVQGKAAPMQKGEGAAPVNVDGEGDDDRNNDFTLDIGHGRVKFGESGSIFDTRGGGSSGFGTLGGGSDGGASTHTLFEDSLERARIAEEERKEAATAHRKFLRKEWGDPRRRAHWTLSGAVPIDHSRVIIQSILIDHTNVTAGVQTMLSTLDSFKVGSFGARGSGPNDQVALEQRMRIMCQSVVTLVGASIPAVRSNEQSRCRNRVSELASAFKSGADMLTASSIKCARAMANPDMQMVLAKYIDNDMTVWTSRVHRESATIGHTLWVPPGSEIDLPPIIRPDWATLKAFLASGALDVANFAANNNRGAGSRKATTATAKDPKKEACQRFLNGKCNKSASECRFSHQPAGGGGKGGSRKGGRGGGAKRGGGEAASPAKKKAKAKEAGDGGFL